MAQYYPQQPYGAQASAQNLQFFPSSYGSLPGHTTPSQAAYGGFGTPPNPGAQAYPVGGGGGSGYGGFGSPAVGVGVSGRMNEQGGLRTGWLAAFGTEGYKGEPPLLEELGVNFEHIRSKVGFEGVRVSNRTNANQTQKDLDRIESLCADRSASHGR